MNASFPTKQPVSALSWWWVALPFVVAAGLVAASGIQLSRQTERVVLPPQGNIAADEFRLVARKIDGLEAQWETALNEEAERLLAAGSDEWTSRVAGVVQISRINPGLSDPSRAHRRLDGTDPRIRPVLERFSKKDPGEWIMPEEVTHGSGWIEEAGKPLAWRQGNGQMAVVLLLDPVSVEGIVATALREATVTGSAEPRDARKVWRTPSGQSWSSHGTVGNKERPDEILRHVSRLGDWTSEQFYPAVVAVSYQTSWLCAALLMAGMLAAGGVWVARWHRSASQLAERRVSFVNQVSHELRTPLTNLLLNADLAIDSLREDEENMRRRLGLIREETSRLSRLVDNVQTFQQMERGQPEKPVTPMDARAVMDSAREIFDPLLARKSIRCGFSCRATGPVMVNGDGFSQILANLLSNIEKYAGEGAEAEVTLTAACGTMQLEVRDNGPGIPKGAGDRVFLPFQRGGSRVDEGASGMGLGLSISRNLAVRMGGTLELLSDRSGGAAFQLTVPLGERSRP